MHPPVDSRKAFRLVHEVLQQHRAGCPLLGHNAQCLLPQLRPQGWIGGNRIDGHALLEDTISPQAKEDRNGELESTPFGEVEPFAPGSQLHPCTEAAVHVRACMPHAQW
jgi:hypothetical protein